MMIKRLAASFGRLQNDTLTLNPGLNIIRRRMNAATWCAFTMLYGIPPATGTESRLSLGWDALPPVGSMANLMEIRTRGDDITLERKTGGRPHEGFYRRFGYGGAVPGLTAKPAMLTGVSEAVFERSAYMSGGHPRHTDAGLEKHRRARHNRRRGRFPEIDDGCAPGRKRRFNKSGTYRPGGLIAGLGRPCPPLKPPLGIRQHTSGNKQRRGKRALSCLKSMKRSYSAGPGRSAASLPPARLRAATPKRPTTRPSAVRGG